MNTDFTRREFIGTAAACAGLLTIGNPSFAEKTGGMKFGLVTYQWGRDWDLDNLIRNCEAAGYGGVELRTQHAHGVEPSLTPAQRAQVKRRFADSGVTCLGYGSNQEYHSPDPQELRRQIAETFELIKLCHDIGASGVKVKPNDLPDGVPSEKTIAQIALSLNEVGRFAQDYGQEIRVEVHGRLSQLPQNMKAIFDQVSEPNVRICWNCNPEDLTAPGLEYNFNLLKKWFGATVHVRELDDPSYPYQQLFRLLTAINYDGWILLEARTEPADRVAAMRLQKQIFTQMVAAAEGVNEHQ